MKSILNRFVGCDTVSPAIWLPTFWDSSHVILNCHKLSNVALNSPNRILMSCLEEWTPTLLPDTSTSHHYTWHPVPKLCFSLHFLCKMTANSILCYTIQTLPRRSLLSECFIVPWNFIWEKYSLPCINFHKNDSSQNVGMGDIMSAWETEIIWHVQYYL